MRAREKRDDRGSTVVAAVVPPPPKRRMTEAAQARLLEGGRVAAVGTTGKAVFAAPAEGFGRRKLPPVSTMRAF